jgi:hypothetical protein
LEDFHLSLFFSKYRVKLYIRKYIGNKIKTLTNEKAIIPAGPLITFNINAVIKNKNSG